MRNGQLYKFTRDLKRTNLNLACRFSELLKWQIYQASSFKPLRIGKPVIIADLLGYYVNLLQPKTLGTQECKLVIPLMPLHDEVQDHSLINFVDN